MKYVIEGLILCAVMVIGVSLGIFAASQSTPAEPAQSTEDYELIAERVHLKAGTVVRVDDLERNAICYLSTVGMSCVQDWNSQ